MPVDIELDSGETHKTHKKQLDMVPYVGIWSSRVLGSCSLNEMK